MGSSLLPITLFFNLLNADALRFVHHRRFCANAGFKLVDHITIIQTIFTNAIFIETEIYNSANELCTRAEMVYFITPQERAMEEFGFCGCKTEDEH